MRAGPVIGIAGASYVVARPFGDLAVHGIPRRYVDHVVGAGGRAVVRPPGIGHDVLDLLDGLVLAGGGDIDPALYGRVGVRAREVDRARDEAEIALVREAREARVPMLGVCRGAQVFAVADGGTLVPDLGPDRPHVLATTSHPIKTFPGSACARLLGLRSQVSSLHHQAIDRTGSGWRSTTPAPRCSAGSCRLPANTPRAAVRSCKVVARAAGTCDVAVSRPGLSVPSGRMIWCTSSVRRPARGSPPPSRSRHPRRSVRGTRSRLAAMPWWSPRRGPARRSRRSCGRSTGSRTNRCRPTNGGVAGCSTSPR